MCRSRDPYTRALALSLPPLSLPPCLSALPLSSAWVHDLFSVLYRCIDITVRCPIEEGTWISVRRCGLHPGPGRLRFACYCIIITVQTTVTASVVEIKSKKSAMVPLLFGTEEYRSIQICCSFTVLATFIGIMNDEIVQVIFWAPSGLFHRSGSNLTCWSGATDQV